MTTPTPERGFSRRTLAVGAAWSVPVVAVAAAAPAYAASGLPTLPLNVSATKSTLCATTVTWTGIPGQNYQVEYRLPTGGFTGTTTATSATTSFSTVFSSPNNIVEVRVRHYLSPTLFSAWVTYTLPVPAAPSTVTAVRTWSTADIWNFYYTVTWAAVAGATSYTVERNESSTGGTWTNATVVNAPVVTTTFTRFILSGQYARVRVRALVCGIYSDWREAVVAEGAGAQQGAAQARSQSNGRSSGPATQSQAVPEQRLPADASASASGVESAPTAEAAPAPAASEAASVADIPSVQPAASATP